jgi:hypothetical protein
MILNSLRPSTMIHPEFEVDKLTKEFRDERTDLKATINELKSRAMDPKTAAQTKNKIFFMEQDIEALKADKANLLKQLEANRQGRPFVAGKHLARNSTERGK